MWAGRKARKLSFGPERPSAAPAADQDCRHPSCARTPHRRVSDGEFCESLAPLGRLGNQRLKTGASYHSRLLMARIVFTTIGSRGDLYPMLPVAARLREHGHHLVFAVPDSLAGDVIREGSHAGTLSIPTLPVQITSRSP